MAQVCGEDLQDTNNAEQRNKLTAIYFDSLKIDWAPTEFILYTM